MYTQLVFYKDLQETFSHCEALHCMHCMCHCMWHCMFFTVYFTRYIQALWYIHCNKIFFTYSVHSVKNHSVYIQGFAYSVTSTVALCCFSQGFHKNVYKPCVTLFLSIYIVVECYTQKMQLLLLCVLLCASSVIIYLFY